MADPTSVRIDLRAALPAAVFGLVVLVIIFVQLCGREHVQPLEDVTPLAQATPAPTFTAGPPVTSGPAEATATVAAQLGGVERDNIRRQDLDALQLALIAYSLDHNGYPDTGGSIQSLCAFKEFDVGCELESVIDPLPVDPLGDPAVNGYWYVSDGATYTIYAIREGILVPECFEHPDHLNDFESVMCALSP
jgi:hypothetical protein